MPAWINDYNRNTLPVQVVTYDKQHGFRSNVYHNLAEALLDYSDLDCDQNGPRFTWGMRGEVNGGDVAIRFESWDAERILSV